MAIVGWRNITDIYRFSEDLKKFENNTKWQKQIIEILKSNDPNLTYEWVEKNDKQNQKQGKDLILYKDIYIAYIDIKAITYSDKPNKHPYLKNIPLELINNYKIYIKTKGKQGISWLFNSNYQTHYVLYYWLDQDQNVRDTLIIINYKDLRKWAEEIFDFKIFYQSISSDPIYNKINSQKKATDFVSYFNGFSIFSCKNEGAYFTINTPIELDFLNKELQKKGLSPICKNVKKDTKTDLIKSETKNLKEGAKKWY